MAARSQQSQQSQPKQPQNFSKVVENLNTSFNTDNSLLNQEQRKIGMVNTNIASLIGQGLQTENISDELENAFKKKILEPLLKDRNMTSDYKLSILNAAKTAIDNNVLENVLNANDLSLVNFKEKVNTAVTAATTSSDATVELNDNVSAGNGQSMNRGRYPKNIQGEISGYDLSNQYLVAVGPTQIKNCNCSNTIIEGKDVTLEGKDKKSPLRADYAIIKSVKSLSNTSVCGSTLQGKMCDAIFNMYDDLSKSPKAVKEALIKLCPGMIYDKNTRFVPSEELCLKNFFNNTKEGKDFLQDNKLSIVTPEDYQKAIDLLNENNDLKAAYTAFKHSFTEDYNDKIHKVLDKFSKRVSHKPSITPDNAIERLKDDEFVDVQKVELEKLENDSPIRKRLDSDKFDSDHIYLIEDKDTGRKFYLAKHANEDKFTQIMLREQESSDKNSKFFVIKQGTLDDDQATAEAYAVNGSIKFDITPDGGTTRKLTPQELIRQVLCNDCRGEQEENKIVVQGKESDSESESTTAPASE